MFKITALIQRNGIVHMWRDISGNLLDAMECDGWEIVETWITPPSDRAIAGRMASL